MSVTGMRKRHIGRLVARAQITADGEIYVAAFAITVCVCCVSAPAATAAQLETWCKLVQQQFVARAPSNHSAQRGRRCHH